MGKKLSMEEDQKGAASRRARGEFVRGISGFRHAISDPNFAAEPGRYHLFVALNCPWCHRVTLARNVLGFQNAITMTSLFRTEPEMMIRLPPTFGNLRRDGWQL